MKLEKKYIVNKDKNTVTCIVYDKDGEPFVGIAKCNEDDTFDEEAGKSLARKRALLNYYHSVQWRYDRVEEYMEEISELWKCALERSAIDAKIKELQNEIQTFF